MNIFTAMSLPSGVFCQRLCSSKVVFHQRSKVIFHWRSSSIEGRLARKVVFHRGLSSIKGCLPSKIIFHQRPSSMESHLPSKVIFMQRASSFKGHLLSKVVFHQRSFPRLVIKIFVYSLAPAYTHIPYFLQNFCYYFPTSFKTVLWSW